MQIDLLKPYYAIHRVRPMYKWSKYESYLSRRSSLKLKSCITLNYVVYSKLRLFACLECSAFATWDHRRLTRHVSTSHGLIAHSAGGNGVHVKCCACKREMHVAELSSHSTRATHILAAQSHVYLRYLQARRRQLLRTSCSTKLCDNHCDERDCLARIYYFKCKLCNYQSRTIREFLDYHSVLRDDDYNDDNNNKNKSNQHRRRLSKLLSIVKRVEGNQIKLLMSFMFGLVKSENNSNRFATTASAAAATTSAEKSSSSLISSSFSIRYHNEITNYDHLSDCNRLNDDFISREIDFNTKSSVF